MGAAAAAAAAACCGLLRLLLALGLLGLLWWRRSLLHNLHIRVVPLPAAGSVLGRVGGPGLLLLPLLLRPLWLLCLLWRRVTLCLVRRPLSSAAAAAGPSPPRTLRRLLLLGLLALGCGEAPVDQHSRCGRCGRWLCCCLCSSRC